MLYSPPIQSQKLLNWPEVREQSTNKIENMLSQVTYVYTFLPIYGSKVKIQMAESFHFQFTLKPPYSIAVLLFKS